MKVAPTVRRAAAVLLLLLPAARGLAQEARSWRDVPKPALRPFQPAVPLRVALPNGLVIFLQEDHELPLVSGSIWIRGGSREEPAAKVGLVDLYGSAWRTGGTTTRTGDALDDFLEARAARVETSGGLTTTSLGWNCLKESLDEVFPVVLELLHKPEFREDKIALARRQIETSISRRNDSAPGIASREAMRLGYGPASPYARTTEYATVRAVTRDDLLAWHREFVHPNNIIVGVTGDFDAKAMEARLRKAFGAWKRGPAARKAAAEGSAAKPGVYVVDKDDVNQSTLSMVHGGIRRDNPDYYAIEVMNEILGGGFTGRLFVNVRTKKGLAYQVGGGIGSSYDHEGLLSIAMGTKSETTGAGIEALLAELKSMRSEPPSVDELSRARDGLLNSFIFRVDSRDELMYERMTYELFGYPLDLLERYRPAIEKVTAADVLRVAQKYINEDKLAIVVVGRTKDFGGPLASFGPVTPIDVQTAAPTRRRFAMKTGRRIVVGITGSTGAIYGVRLLEALRGQDEVETHLVISAPGKRTIVEETDRTVRDVEALADATYDNRDIGAAIASGSFRTEAMVIAPCSMKSASSLAHCYGNTLISRAGDVTLKEGRTLVALVRETPLHVGHLRILLALAEIGAVVMPPMPAFYQRPRTVDDIVNHTVGRVLDRLGLPQDLVPEWTGTGARRAEVEED